MSEKKLCVLGGNGNIGRYVVRHLHALGFYDVTCLNRGLTSPNHPGVRHIAVDRYDASALIDIGRRERFDTVIDLSCYDLDSARVCLRAFADASHFIHCSSILVYGRNLRALPAREDHPLTPEGDRYFDYADGKRQADRLYLDAFRRDGFPVTILRPSLTFSGMFGLARQLGVDTDYLARIKAGLPIVVSGDGMALQQFMHADDCGRVFALFAGRAEFAGEIFNVAGRQPTTWRDYHASIMRAAGRVVEQVGVPFEILDALAARPENNITDVFWRNSFVSTDKLYSAFPDFDAQYDLDRAISEVFLEMERDRRIPDAPRAHGWESAVVSAHRGFRARAVRTSRHSSGAFARARDLVCRDPMR